MLWDRLLRRFSLVRDRFDVGGASRPRFSGRKPISIDVAQIVENLY